MSHCSVKEPECASPYSTLLSSLYCSNLRRVHMNGPSEVRTEIRNSTHFPKALDLDQILIFLNGSVENDRATFTTGDNWRLKLAVVIGVFFTPRVCLTAVWCLITGRAPGESCPSAWQTLASCIGMSCQEPWLASPASAASSRMTLISSAPWIRWGCATIIWINNINRAAKNLLKAQFDKKNGWFCLFYVWMCQNPIWWF